jgi:hypothetical protein
MAVVVPGTIRLRRSTQPYIGIGLACALFLALLVVIAAETRDWTPVLEFGWLPPFLFMGWVALGMRYQVSFTDTTIEMHASGLAPAFMRFDEIARVENEASTQQGRPLRRIAIYSRKQGGKVKWIDISLKHFAIHDIRVLLDIIRQKRPDLGVPQI